jgi:hypothetical protein
MPKFDVTKLNMAIDKLLETAANPRHRFMLQAPRGGAISALPSTSNKGLA